MLKPGIKSAQKIVRVGIEDFVVKLKNAQISQERQGGSNLTSYVAELLNANKRE